MTQRKQPIDPRPDDDLAARLLRAAGSRETAPPDLEARARAVVEAHWRQQVAARRRPHRWLFQIALPLAAASLLTIGAGVWWVRGGSRTDAPVASIAEETAIVRWVQGAAVTAVGRDGERDPSEPLTLAVGSSVAAGSRLETGDDGVVSLALDDSTSLRLAPRTRVVWSGRGRAELASGTIYVDHAGSASTPSEPTLEVLTPFGTVTDVGTQFELAVSDTALRVRVREGAVTFATAEERHLAPAGVELDWSGSGAVTRRAIARSGEPWDWVIEAAPAIDLEGRTLDEALAWIARETGYTVAWPDAALHSRAGAERIVGELVLRPSEAVTILPRLFGLAARLENGTLTVVGGADG